MTIEDMSAVRKNRPKMGKEEDIAMFELCKKQASVKGFDE